MFWKLAAASTPVGKARDHFFDLVLAFLRVLCGEKLWLYLLL
ncbi:MULTISPECIES: hypothetical protein [Shewanella]|nr:MULTISPECIES: hypothetical protein [Shewanella]